MKRNRLGLSLFHSWIFVAVSVLIGAGLIVAVWLLPQEQSESAWQDVSQQVHTMLESKESEKNSSSETSAQNNKESKSTENSMNAPSPNISSVEVNVEPVSAMAGTTSEGKPDTKTEAIIESNTETKAADGAAAKSETSSDSSGESKMNINQATAEQLTQLPGIGPSKAKAIIEYREKNGAYKKVEDLLEVKGIGPKVLEKLKPHIQI
ncbi:ComEA family DNA-binding protein [Paenibacillus marinisediminis]